MEDKILDTNVTPYMQSLKIQYESSTQERKGADFFNEANYCKRESEEEMLFDMRS